MLLARRGPAQAAFTTPGAEGARRAGGRGRGRRSGRPRARPGERGRARGRHERRARNVEVLREYAAREPAGKPTAVALRFCVSPVAILGEERVEAIELVRNELVADEGGRIARRADRASARRSRAGSSSAASAIAASRFPGVPFDERAATIPNEGGRVSTRAASRCRRVLRRLDQARPERRDRDEQEGRDRDGRAAARGRARPEAAHAATAEPRDLEELLAERGVEPVDVRRLGGDRRVEKAARRAARPAAGQAPQLGRAPLGRRSRRQDR